MRKQFGQFFIILLVVSTVACLDSLDPATSDCERSGLAISIINVTSTDCGIPNGRIEVFSSGGLGDKSYFLNDGPAQKTGVFHSLRPGIYSVSVMDSLYCSRAVSVHISSGISFKESIQPIIENSCIISTCHDGSGSISFKVFANIKKSAADIKGLTGARVMPKTGSLTNDEIEQIACWVDDGALFN
ncbi:MAG: hypothetical protein RIB71_05970 [Imperialibacter sp.]|uniref:hypothetical protein n=1 Tax=Imperialibacter sp. TaxID=2038411 RepID=UPI0032EAF421